MTICGCKDQCLQCKLLAEPDLTFEKAFKIVALSQVRTLDGVALLDLVASKIKSSAIVQQEIARLPTGQP